ncbi:hypothetical protein BV25DRAFT_1917183 [Artomyces pyxidatus]|uniref:Uncharacterized protein n=1 Tax=Artomyces pyxidatus TaxID=48021 RepID=A0ACB8SZE4_9AGAM|nr:hypothetical protein BV25DRAFT_1917183 [Artomyces pyxidatus]
MLSKVPISVFLTKSYVLFSRTFSVYNSSFLLHTLEDESDYDVYIDRLTSVYNEFRTLAVLRHPKQRNEKKLSGLPYPLPPPTKGSPLERMELVQKAKLTDSCLAWNGQIVWSCEATALRRMSNWKLLRKGLTVIPELDDNDELLTESEPEFDVVHERWNDTPGPQDNEAPCPQATGRK